MYVMRVYVIYYIINYAIHHVIGVIVVNFLMMYLKLTGHINKVVSIQTEFEIH